MYYLLQYYSFVLHDIVQVLMLTGNYFDNRIILFIIFCKNAENLQDLRLFSVIQDSKLNIFVIEDIIVDSERLQPAFFPILLFPI